MRKIDPAMKQLAHKMHPIDGKKMIGYKTSMDDRNKKLIMTINEIFKDNGIKVRLDSIVLPDIRSVKIPTNVEISESSLISYIFTFKIFDKYEYVKSIQLPVPIGNRLTISDRLVRILPVLTESVINVASNDTCISMVKKNVIISNLTINMIKNGTDSVLGEVSWSSLHKPSTRGKMRTPIIIYRLMEEGYKGIFGSSIKFVKLGIDPIEDGWTQYNGVDNIDGDTIISMRNKDIPKHVGRISQMCYIFNMLNLQLRGLENIESNEYDLWFSILCMLSSNGEPVSFNQHDMRQHMGIVKTLNEAKTLKRLGVNGINTFPRLLDYVGNSIKSELKKNSDYLEVDDYFYEPFSVAATQVAQKILLQQPEHGAIEGIINKFFTFGMFYRILKNQVCVEPYMQNNPAGFFKHLKVVNQKVLTSDRATMIPKVGDMKDLTINMIPKSVPYPNIQNPYKTKK